MSVEGEVKRESKAGPEAADDKQQVGPHGSRFKRITANRSLKIERDEAPDPDVKHIAGEATGTRAERYTVGTIEVGRREIIEQNRNFLSRLAGNRGAKGESSPKGLMN